MFQATNAQPAHFITRTLGLALVWALVLPVVSACADRTVTEPPMRMSRVSGGSALTLPTLSVPAVTYVLPPIDETVNEVDMCAVLTGLCGNPICPAGEVTGPSSDRKGTGFSLRGCGNLTELKFKNIRATMSGQAVLGAAIDPALFDADPGCVEQTVTIPGRPAIPGTPPVLGPGGFVIWPGTPSVPAVSPRTITFRVPTGCDPIRPPSFGKPAEFLGFEGYIHPTVDVSFDVEASGSGEVELRLPIPKVSKSLKALVGQDGDEYLVSGAVGMYFVMRGRLSETTTRFSVRAADEFNARFNYSAATGWTSSLDQGPFALTSAINVMSPDTAVFRYGVQPAVSFVAEPFPPNVPGVLVQRPGFQVEAGLWVYRYFENVFTAQANGNLKNDSNAGVEGRAYASYVPVDVGQEGPCALDAILGCIEGVLSPVPGGTHDRLFACCQAELYDQYGIGQFKFKANTTGAAADLDADGYQLSWTRASATPVPSVDSVLTAAIGANGTAFYPNTSEAISNLPSNPFSLYTSASCTEFYSDLALTFLVPIAGFVVPELRRQGFDAPLFSKVVGCTALPADYRLSISGLAENCTLAGANPRVVTLRPLLNLTRLGVAVRPITWTQVSDVTDVELSMHCRPLVGDVRVTAATTGVDQDRDGYSVALNGAVAGGVGANASTLLTSIRVGVHTVGLGGAGFNCAVAAPNPRDANVGFEAVTDVELAVSCVSVYVKACETVGAVDGGALPDSTKTALCATLRAAGESRDRGNKASAAGQLGAFRNQVNSIKESGLISEDGAALLLSHAAYIVNNGFFM